MKRRLITLTVDVAKADEVLNQEMTQQDQAKTQDRKEAM